QGVRLVGEAHALEQLLGLGIGLRLGDAAHAPRPEGDVVDGLEVREEVEALEHHAHVGPEAGEVLALLGQPLPVDGDLAVGDRLETVQAAAQGGLPGAGGADQRHHLAAVDVQVDVLQRLEVAEELVDAARGDERVTDAAALVHAPRMLCSATSVHIMTRLAACRNGFVTAAGTALTPCAAPGAPRAAAAAAPPRRPPRPLARPAPTGRGRRGGAGGSGLVGALVDRVEG